jgi:hypothetical protein
MKGGDMSSVSPLVSFVLGAAMATVCVLFFMSAAPARRLVDISAFTSNSNSTADLLLDSSTSSDSPAAADLAEATAPAPAPVQVPPRTRFRRFVSVSAYVLPACAFVARNSTAAVSSSPQTIHKPPTISPG